MSVANELMLDRLKAVCSDIIRAFGKKLPGLMASSYTDLSHHLVNLNTVCALLCEAIYYEAPGLQEVCMQYIVCNIETMLEQRLLDLLPVHALDKLAAFSRKRQLDRLPRTARSTKANAELCEKYADFLKELDIPRATGGYRRYTRNPSYSIRSPKLSPAQFSASLRLSPNLSSSPTLVLSPPTSAAKVPPSPALSAVSVTSPSVRPTDGDDGDTFEMEDLQLDSSVPPAALPVDPLRTLTSSARMQVPQGLPWRRPQSSSIPTASLHDIMAQETKTPPKNVYTPPRRISETPPLPRKDELPMSPPQRLTQKERKRQQAVTQEVPTPSSAEKASSPWRPILPGTWAPPEAVKDTPTLASIQSQQRSMPSSTNTPRSASGRGTPEMSSPLNRRMPSASGAKNPEGNSHQGRDVSAANAPVITPVRLQPKRDVSSSYNRPPETRSHDTPWVNYLSTVSVTAQPETIASGKQSFANIQNLQNTEKDALQKARGPMR